MVLSVYDFPPPPLPPPTKIESKNNIKSISLFLRAVPL